MFSSSLSVLPSLPTVKRLSNPDASGRHTGSLLSSCRHTARQNHYGRTYLPWLTVIRALLVHRGKVWGSVCDRGDHDRVSHVVTGKGAVEGERKDERLSRVAE